MASARTSSAARAAGRVASLMAGGLVAHRAFAALAAEEGAEPEIVEMAHEVAGGRSIVDALAAGPGSDWRVLGAAWALADESGAPLAGALERIAASLGRLEEVAERKKVLLSGPIATIRTVIALPPLSLVMGWLLGFDPFRVLFGARGWPLLLIGAALLLLGNEWGRRLVRSAVGTRSVSGLEFDLAQISLRGGAGIGVARRRTADAVDRAGAEWIPFDRLTDQAPLARFLAAAGNTGAPLGGLLAAESRRRAAASLSELERSCERLGVRILLPVCACALPSFVVVGIVPVVIAMLSGF